MACKSLKSSFTYIVLNKDFLSPAAATSAAIEKKTCGGDADADIHTMPTISKNYDDKEIRSSSSGITETNLKTVACSSNSMKFLKYKNIGLHHSSTVISAAADSFEIQLQNSTTASDAEGNRVWICPACGKVDDGSAMIGCDGCDAWYHWVCVGIFVAPKDNEDWFCRVCIAKKKGSHGIDKKRKRNKKNK